MGWTGDPVRLAKVSAVLSGGNERETEQISRPSDEPPGFLFTGEVTNLTKMTKRDKTTFFFFFFQSCGHC